MNRSVVILEVRPPQPSGLSACIHVLCLANCNAVECSAAQPFSPFPDRWAMLPWDLRLDQLRLRLAPQRGPTMTPTLLLLLLQLLLRSPWVVGIRHHLLLHPQRGGD